jgi:uncharacterized protein (DUF3084 family)
MLISSNPLLIPGIWSLASTSTMVRLRMQRAATESSCTKKRCSQGQNRDSQGQNRESQGQNRDSQGQNRDNQGQNRDSQGQNRDNQGQNRESQGQKRNRGIIGHKPKYFSKKSLKCCVAS